MSDFRIGDVVVNIRFGEGVVTDITVNSALVKFKHYSKVRFMLDGRLEPMDYNPSIYHRKGFELVPGKPDRAKPIQKFKPGQIVLICMGDKHKWVVDIFSHSVKYPDERIGYVCASRGGYYCLPLEGNEHLAGTDFDKATQEGL